MVLNGGFVICWWLIGWWGDFLLVRLDVCLIPLWGVIDEWKALNPDYELLIDISVRLEMVFNHESRVCWRVIGRWGAVFSYFAWSLSISTEFFLVNSFLLVNWGNMDIIWIELRSELYLGNLPTYWKALLEFAWWVQILISDRSYSWDLCSFGNGV